eukprot:9025375-Pyramimonas_sp.AAC.1
MSPNLAALDDLLQVAQYALAHPGTSFPHAPSVPAPANPATPISLHHSPPPAPQSSLMAAGSTLPDLGPSGCSPLVFDGTFYRLQKGAGAPPLGSSPSIEESCESCNPGTLAEIDCEESSPSPSTAVGIERWLCVDRNSQEDSFLFQGQ